jgi:protein-S-isoprenylcysteine O-methyltransferase Ste14
MKDWDKVVGGLFGVMYFLVVPLVAGLDFRFGWTSGTALAVQLTGAAAFSLGFGLLIWAMVSNAHFATVVRIEQDRGHSVCTSGPYRFVRHPGYVGAMLHSLTVPLILGSLWTLVPGGMAALLLVVRTALEDRTLQEELDGYTAYAMQVRHRLIPGVW